MMEKIKKLIKENRTILSNFSYMSFLQVAVLLIPLVTYPYLIRVLGKDFFGLLVFTQTIAGYFTIFISFGFTMFGVREVSIYRENKEKLSEIVSTIFFLKSIFLLFCLGLLFLYFVFFGQEYRELYLLAFWLCLSDVIFPIWFFQGIEKMKFITIISLVSKFLVLVLTFVLIQSPSDLIWHPIVQLIGVVASGFFSFYVIKKEGLYFVFPTFKIMKEYVKKSYHFFISNVFIQVYGNSNKLIIGSFLGMRSLAYYDLVEKIINLTKTPQVILSQTLFPRISKDKNKDFIKKIFVISIFLNLFLYVFLYFSAKYIVLLLGGEEMLLVVPMIKLMGIIVPIVAVNNVFGVLTLASFGFEKLFTKSIMLTVVVHLLCFGLLWWFDGIELYNLIYLNILVDIVISSLCFYFVYQKEIIWNKKSQ